MKRSCSIVTFNHGFTTRLLRQQWAGHPESDSLQQQLSTVTAWLTGSFIGGTCGQDQELLGAQLPL